MEIEWKKLVEDNYIKYIDNCEVENSVIAMDQNDLQKFKEDKGGSLRCRQKGEFVIIVNISRLHCPYSSLALEILQM